MSLTAKDVAEIQKLLEDSSFDELDLELDGMKLSLKRAGARAATPPADEAREKPRRLRLQDAGVVGAAVAAVPASPAVPSRDPNVHDVEAPQLGTFYRAPKPGAAPYVDVGSRVEEGTIIGLIEVMKLMNTVRSGVSGSVVEIVARDGALVEYGETLLRVRVAAPEEAAHG